MDLVDVYLLDKVGQEHVPGADELLPLELLGNVTEQGAQVMGAVGEFDQYGYRAFQAAGSLQDPG